MHKSSLLFVVALPLLSLGCTFRASAGPGGPPPGAPPPGAPVAPPPGAPVAPPQEEPGWALIGQKQVAFHVDHDVIAADPGPTYRSLRLHVGGNDLDMYDIRITFGNGQVWSPETRLHFAQGTGSRQIDLPGDARHIRRVDFAYRALGPAQGHAFVHVFGHS